MNSVILISLSFVGYLIAYKTYGKFLAGKIFNLSGKAEMPAVKQNDGVDYVPTKPNIVFGHHFTTIAGLGPIVGPAIGIMWGWLPAFLWVFIGSIFMGAVHDFSILVISARNNGKTIGELSGTLLGMGSSFAFQLIMQILLFVVLSVFALIVSTLFILYPETVIPVWIQIPLAIWLGKLIRSGKNERIYSIFFLLIMYASIWLGRYIPIDLASLGMIKNMNLTPEATSNLVTVIWCLILFIYVYIASTLPVHRLLQPRDYINSQQLLLIIILLVVAVFVAHPVITAPPLNQKAFEHGNDVPDLFPVLFIVIACGAISGFHSIASSGTTVKQIKNEKDTFFIGYGSMLTEGFLAILVLVCVASGLGLGLETNEGVLEGRAAYWHYFSSWNAATSGIGAKLESFIIGSANLLEQLGIPKYYGRPLIAVFIVSFANTTLDSATRIQRLSLQEMLTLRKQNSGVRFLNNRYFLTAFIVLLAAIMTFLKPGGKGALLLWPIFGTLNQLLAALGLAVVTVFLFLKKKNYLLSLIPMLFILIMTLWSMGGNIVNFIQNKDYFLTGLSLVILVLSDWLLIGGIRSLCRARSQKRTSKAL